MCLFVDIKKDVCEDAGCRADLAALFKRCDFSCGRHSGISAVTVDRLACCKKALRSLRDEEPNQKILRHVAVCVGNFFHCAAEHVCSYEFCPQERRVFFLNQPGRKKLASGNESVVERKLSAVLCLGENVEAACHNVRAVLFLQRPQGGNCAALQHIVAVKHQDKSSVRGVNQRAPAFHKSAVFGMFNVGHLEAA